MNGDQGCNQVRGDIGRRHGKFLLRGNAGEFGPHRDSVLRLPLHQFPIEGTKISEAGPPPSNRSSRGKHRRTEKQGVSKEWGRERSFVLRED